jgi:secreted protein with Ig-like and vWFA domain
VCPALRCSADRDCILPAAALGSLHGAAVALPARLVQSRVPVLKTESSCNELLLELVSVKSSLALGKLAVGKGLVLLTFNRGLVRSRSFLQIQSASRALFYVIDLHLS